MAKSKGSSGSNKTGKSKRTVTAAARRTMSSVSSRNTGNDTPF